MPLSSSDVLDAYRADLSNASKAQFSERDGTWLAFGTLLQRAVGMRAAERAAYLQSASIAIRDGSHDAGLEQALTDLARDGSSASALCSVATTFAVEAEEAGGFALATAMLDYARILVGLSEVRLQGRLLAHQARILRKIGETDLSQELFDQVGAMGTMHQDPELVARSHLGKGVLARIRGNYPAARREYLSVLEVPESSSEMRELHSHAHYGLLVVSAIGKDFDAALSHGAMAMARATTEQHRIELLQNLATICSDIGQYRSALNGFLEVLAGTTLDRVRLSSFGGATIAAARLGEEATVRQLVAAAAPLLTGRGPEYERADMCREFAEAFAYLEDADEWRRYRDEALERAKRGKFFEIVHRIESMKTPRRPTPPPPIALTEDALAVTARLASGDSTRLLAAAVSNGRSDFRSR